MRSLSWSPGSAARAFRRRALIALSGVLILFAFLGLNAARALADSTAATGDESVQAPTAWWAYAGVSISTISSLLNANGARLVDFRQDANGAYTAVMVKNSGKYAVAGWWWYANVSQAQVSSTLSTNNARLISAQRNSAGNYNVVEVSNTGTAARTWWWYSGVTTGQISSALSANNGRLVSVVPDPTAGQYTAVMVSNTGADAKTWWWYVNQTPANVSSLLNTNKGRLVDLNVEANGNFDVIMVKQAGTATIAWKWYYGTSPQFIVGAAGNTGYRVFDLIPYGTAPNLTYAGLMINNLAAEPRRVENILESGYNSAGLSNGTWGFYTKPIKSAATLAFNDGTIYEPASGIKAVYNLYAQRQVQLGNDSLASTFHYWYDPSNPTNTGPCPLNYSNTSSNEITTTLEDGLDRMMQVSDNRATQGVDLRYGRSNVNNYAASIGMHSTLINQTVGCGNLNGGYVHLTLDDISTLYQGVYKHTFLNAANAGALESSDNSTFFGRMLGGQLSTSDPLASVISQEAAKQGKSADVSAFEAAVYGRDKGGSYDECPTSGACSPPYIYDRSDAGVLELPFKSSGSVVEHVYTYGYWVNNVLIPCTFGTSCTALNQADSTTGQIRAEQFRAQVKAALKTW